MRFGDEALKIKMTLKGTVERPDLGGVFYFNAFINEYQINVSLNTKAVENQQSIFGTFVGMPRPSGLSFNLSFNVLAETALEAYYNYVKVFHLKAWSIGGPAVASQKRFSEMNSSAEPASTTGTYVNSISQPKQLIRFFPITGAEEKFMNITSLNIKNIDDFGHFLYPGSSGELLLPKAYTIAIVATLDASITSVDSEDYVNKGLSSRSFISKDAEYSIPLKDRAGAAAANAKKLEAQALEAQQKAADAAGTSAAPAAEASAKKARAAADTAKIKADALNSKTQKGTGGSSAGTAGSSPAQDTTVYD